jgi:hypothetical protein
MVGNEYLRRKKKSRDIGYALAARSCEGACSVDACTITAFDVITAFAVPNPGDSSQTRRFFRVWLLPRSPRSANHPVYFGLAKFYFEPTLSTVDARKVNAQSSIVNAAFRCNAENLSVQNSERN